MFARLLQAALFAGACLLAHPGQAAPMAFIPPGDTVGSEYGAANDSWSMGRGIIFGVAKRQSITGVGLLHDLSGIDLSYGLYEISTSSITLTRLATLAAGGSTVSTDGRSWIDYGLAGLVLDPDKQYLLEFAFRGDANSNFYYDNQNLRWDQGAFTGMDGTLGDELGNFVVAGLRIDASDVAAIPEPGSLALMAFGIALVARRRPALAQRTPTAG